ncbi:metallo-beta-lactamase superfamily hydrolase [Klebsiella oxytoca]|nr:metallo-beta-lactamase superfamily hydrolase [Klebsiella oxytoca]
MRLPQLAGCVIIGILPLLWLPDLPGRSVTWGLMLLVLLIAQCRRRAAQYAALITLFFCLGSTQRSPGPMADTDVNKRESSG